MNKVRSKCTLRKGGFFKVISGTFWRCLQYKAKQYFVGEDQMFCRSWQYYVNDRCVKGKVCSCLERIFRSKTHFFCNRSKIWFFHFCEKKKWRKKIRPSKLFSENVMQTETILRPHTTFVLQRCNCLPSSKLECFA